MNAPAQGNMNFAFAAIVVAFIVYITAKGELSTYLQLFLYTPPATTGSGVTSTGGGSGISVPAGNPGMTGTWDTSGIPASQFAAPGAVRPGTQY